MLPDGKYHYASMSFIQENKSGLVNVAIEDKPSLIPVVGGHVFEYRHEESDSDEKQSKEDSRSIFEIRHHRQQLNSLGNER